LYINGLETESIDMGIKSADTIFQKISGRYPGGQKALDSKIDEIKSKSGPCTFPATFDPFVFTPDGNVVDKLQEFGFRIISQKSNNFELEYKNGYDEACCRLGDALLELYQEKNQS
jgi:hypothetical protein